MFLAVLDVKALFELCGPRLTPEGIPLGRAVLLITELVMPTAIKTPLSKTHIVVIHDTVFSLKSQAQWTGC